MSKRFLERTVLAVLATWQMACEGPVGPMGLPGAPGEPGAALEQFELVAIRITQEHYGALYSPYRKVVVLNDLRVWISMRRSDAERGGTTLLGVYVRRGKSNLNDFEFVPVELWLRVRPGYDAEAYGEVVILSDPGVVYIQDPNEFLLGQTVVLAVLPGSPRIE